MAHDQYRHLSDREMLQEILAVSVHNSAQLGRVITLTAAEQQATQDLIDVTTELSTDFQNFTAAVGTEVTGLQTQVSTLTAAAAAGTPVDPAVAASIETSVANLKQLHTSFATATAAATGSVATTQPIVSAPTTPAPTDPTSTSPVTPAAPAPTPGTDVPLSQTPIAGDTTTGQVGADASATATTLQPGSPSPTSSNS